ncbi:hypothetical protein J2X52_001611 [Luteimonas sp. 3794]|nr:hypothetical protein [Luteimonas sp. 3794]
MQVDVTIVGPEIQEHRDAMRFLTVIPAYAGMTGARDPA